MRIANHTYSGLPSLGVRLAVDRNPAHETRRPVIYLVLGAVLCCVGLFSIVGGIVSTDKEVHRYLEMPAYVGTVPENIQVAIWQDLPIGSSRSDVEQFLALRGIGRDRGSSCSTDLTGRNITCQLGVDHHAWELVRETFNLSFTCDSGGRLRSITVRSSFSSPL